MNAHQAQTEPSRLGALLLIAATTIVGGAIIGVTTNAINGVVSPIYFQNVMRWHRVEDIWSASIVRPVPPAISPRHSLPSLAGRTGPTALSMLIRSLSCATGSASVFFKGQPVLHFTSGACGTRFMGFPWLIQAHIGNRHQLGPPTQTARGLTTPARLVLSFFSASSAISAFHCVLFLQT